jgi:hypothetical protein
MNVIRAIPKTYHCQFPCSFLGTILITSGLKPHDYIHTVNDVIQ